MSRLTDNDRNFGPFTVAPWKGYFAAWLQSGDDEDPGNTILLIAFGWALRIAIPTILQPHKEKKQALFWDADTIARMGRDWYWDVDEREYGFALTKSMGNGYDFLSVHFGRQTHDSSTTQDWCWSLPWKQWNHVRHSIYEPDGTLFANEPQDRRGMEASREWWAVEEKCPVSHFGFEDYDGKMIIATCRIEEREWHRGTGRFKWLKWFYPKLVKRSLDLKFSSEVGPEKGSWKGGTIGHGIEMLSGETPRQAFERYCSKEHDARHGRKFTIRFVGPCAPPPPKAKQAEEAAAQTAKG